MNLNRRYRLCTWIAGSASLAMGAFHLVLPQVLGWGPYVKTLPPAVHWGVYSINCFFSVLLILGALLSLRTRIDSGEAARLVPLGMSVTGRMAGAANMDVRMLYLRRVIPLDTTAAAHDKQREVYLRLGGRGRVAIMYGLNDTVRRLTMAGIRARHPSYTDDQVRFAYARLTLGDALTRAAWPDQELVDP